MPCCGGDGRRGAAGGMQQFCGFAGDRHGIDGEHADRWTSWVRSQCAEDGLAEAALWPVIFDGDDAAGVVCCGGEGGFVDRLDRVAVDYSDSNAVVGEGLSSFDRFGNG